MRVQNLHRWDLSPAEAIAVQQNLRTKVVTGNEVGPVHTVAGVDISTTGERAHAAIVVLTFPDLQPLEAAEADLPLTFPYIPGLLAFREAPAILTAIERLQNEPDLFLVDGQGLAHPRRMGIACHIGVVIDKPSIGCAKSLLCGHHGMVGPKVGDYSEIKDQDQVIGVALRTKEGVSPVYISIGHKVDLPTAIEYVLRCGGGYRIPEPIRWAHRVAGGEHLPKPQPRAEQGMLF
nr:deoxyribonuclease V [Chloroflexota bacterium]